MPNLRAKQSSANGIPVPTKCRRLACSVRGSDVASRACFQAPAPNLPRHSVDILKWRGRSESCARNWRRRESKASAHWVEFTPGFLETHSPRRYDVERTRVRFFARLYESLTHPSAAARPGRRSPVQPMIYRRLWSEATHYAQPILLHL
jgi:hypothetical protein